MLPCMDPNLPGGSRKTIRVRKQQSSSKNNFNYDDDFYIPIAASDSQWNGIKFEPQKNENTEHINNSSAEETEIKVIELESDTSPPLFLLFPELKKEELNVQDLVGRQLSTTDITKILVGKKPNLALLKSSKRLDNVQREMSSVIELSESEESTERKKIRNKEHLQRYRKDSMDADDSDNADDY